MSTGQHLHWLRAVCMTDDVSLLQGYIDSLKSETDDYLEERYREGRDAVSLLERVRSGGSAADGGGQQRQQHSSSGGGILGSIFGGRKQETRCCPPAFCAICVYQRRQKSLGIAPTQTLLVICILECHWKAAFGR